MTKPTPGDEMAETADASPTGSTAGGHGRAGAAATVTAAGTADPRERSAGDVMDRYEIVGVLGTGGMGRVYRARDPDLNRDLAIKVLRRAEGSSAGGLERRLLREAQAMAKLSHPNLATVYDVGTVDGEVFIAFEFIDGQTLGAWARAGRTVSERLAALVAAGRGLEAAHSAGVIHRDFKPDNVLVGKDGAVKVVDFGLARGLGETRGDAPPTRGDELAVDLTQTGSILGTPAYMAPEQHHGMVADARADQFNFAVSAWEVLYGERPFRGATYTALATAICAGQITGPPATASVTAAVEAVLRKALAVEPDRRFADMGALLAKLAAPAVAVAPPRVSVWRDYKTALIAFGVACLALLGVYVGYETNRVRKPQPAAAVPDAGTGIEAFRTVTSEMMSEHRDKVVACYDVAQSRAIELGPGVVKINFTLDAAGKVVSTGILADDFGGEHGIATCVAAQSLTWTFPAPPGGAGAALSFPFAFEPRLHDITRVDDDITISRATWDSWSGASVYLTRGITFVPSEIDKKQVGYKLFGVDPTSVHSLLGAQNGDLITHVNAIALESPRVMFDLDSELDGSKPIVVRLKRHGRLTTLTYRIAP